MGNDYQYLVNLSFTCETVLSAGQVLYVLLLNVILLYLTDLRQHCIQNKTGNPTLTHLTLRFQERPATLFEEALRVINNGLHDFSPVEGLYSFCVL